MLGWGLLRFPSTLAEARSSLSLGLKLLTHSARITLASFVALCARIGPSSEQDLLLFLELPAFLKHALKSAIAAFRGALRRSRSSLLSSAVLIVS